MKFSMVEVSLTSSDPRLPSISLDVLDGAHKLGAETIVFAADPSVYDVMPGHFVDRWVECDTRDPASIAAAAKQLGPDCLVGVSDLFTDVANAAAVELGLASNEDSTAFERNKAAVRRSLDQASVPNLDWAVLDVRGDVPSAFRFPFPAITKPVDGSASWDIALVADLDELRAAMKHHADRTTYGRGVTPSGSLLVEQVVDGDLYSVEGFRHDGVTELWGYTGRVLSDPPYFIELAMSFGSGEPVAGLGQYVLDVLDATNFRFGAFHIEVMSTPDGPILIEINARPMGHGCHQCVNALADRPLGDELASLYLGRGSCISIPSGAATIGHQLAPRAGRVITVHGVDEARALPNVHAVNTSKSAGDTVLITHSNSDCIAHCVAVGADRAEATRRAFDGVSRVLFDIEPE
jgi:biotin carboxylase